jgi:hypothetical protein
MSSESSQRAPSNGKWTPEQRARLSASMKRARRKAGASWFKKARRGRPPADIARTSAGTIRVPNHIYVLAKRLRTLTRAHIVTQDGDVDDLAMTAIALTRELLGE